MVTTQKIERKLPFIMVADIEGYTAINQIKDQADNMVFKKKVREIN